MSEFRCKKRTYRKIAEIFNLDGVATKTKKELFCGKSVWTAARNKLKNSKKISSQKICLLKTNVKVSSLRSFDY